MGSSRRGHRGTRRTTTSRSRRRRHRSLLLGYSILLLMHSNGMSVSDSYATTAYQCYYSLVAITTTNEYRFDSTCSLYKIPSASALGYKPNECTIVLKCM